MSTQRTHSLAVGRWSLTLVLGLLAALLPLFPPAANAAGVDTNDRQAVADAFNNVYRPASGTARTWNGSIPSCDAGTFGAAGQQATLTTINYYRSLAGLNPVTFDTALSAKTQKAALVMRANESLSHYPASDWACWSQDAYDAAGKSNIALAFSWGFPTFAATAAGSGAVDMYMVDSGSNNLAVGHRRWVLNAGGQVMGSGSVVDGEGSANALWVIGNEAPAGSYPNPEWVGWPTAGHFPQQHEPLGRWSLSVARGVNADFTNAQVSVRDPLGAALALTQHAPDRFMAADTLAWNFTNPIPKVTGSGVDTYTVTVSNVVVNGRNTSHTYQVKLFDPAEAWHAGTFLDVPLGTQFYDEIEWLAARGISTGWTVPGGKVYRPLEPVARDAMAAFLYRFAGSPAVTLPATSPFVDLEPGDQFYDEIVWLHQRGISTGWDLGDGQREYRPLTSINRDAMAAFMYRFAGSPSFTPPPTSPFMDVTPGATFSDEMAWMYERGISTGWAEPGGLRSYRPLTSVNRDAMAAFLKRLDGIA